MLRGDVEVRDAWSQLGVSWPEHAWRHVIKSHGALLADDVKSSFADMSRVELETVVSAHQLFCVFLR